MITAGLFFILGMLTTFILFVAGAYFTRAGYSLLESVETILPKERGSIYIPDEDNERRQLLIETADEDIDLENL